MMKAMQRTEAEILFTVESRTCCAITTQSETVEMGFAPSPKAIIIGKTRYYRSPKGCE